jgi:hypothetical protein
MPTPPPYDCSNAGACIEYGSDRMTELRCSFSLRDSISVPAGNPSNRSRGQCPPARQTLPKVSPPAGEDHVEAAKTARDGGMAETGEPRDSGGNGRAGGMADLRRDLRDARRKPAMQ